LYDYRVSERNKENKVRRTTTRRKEENVRQGSHLQSGTNLVSTLKHTLRLVAASDFQTFGRCIGKLYEIAFAASTATETRTKSTGSKENQQH